MSQQEMFHGCLDYCVKKVATLVTNQVEEAAETGQSRLIEERCCFIGRVTTEGLGLDPFGSVVGSDQNVAAAYVSSLLN